MKSVIARLISTGPRCLPPRGPCSDLLGQSLPQPPSRNVDEIATRLARLPRPVARVPRHGRKVPHRQAPAEELAEDLDHLDDRGLSASCDVVRLAGTSPIGRRDGRADRVVDVGEVASLKPVAEYLDF